MDTGRWGWVRVDGRSVGTGSTGILRLVVVRVANVVVVVIVWMVVIIGEWYCSSGVVVVGTQFQAPWW